MEAAQPDISAAQSRASFTRGFLSVQPCYTI